MPPKRKREAFGAVDSGTAKFVKILDLVKTTDPSTVVIGSEFWHTLESSPWARLLTVRKKREGNENVHVSKTDSRTATIAFLLGLWTRSTPAAVKSQVLGFKALLPSLLKGLPDDSDHVVASLLQQLWKGVIKDTSVDARVRVNLAEKLVEALIDLCDFKDVDEDAQRRTENPRRFILALSTNIKKLGLSQALQRKLATTIISSAKISEPGQALAIVKLCDILPDMTYLVWNKLLPSLEAKPTTRWIFAAAKAIDVISLPVKDSNKDSNVLVRLTRSGQKVPSISSMLDLCFPSSTSKGIFAKGLQHENHLVTFITTNLLAASLVKVIEILHQIEIISNQRGEGDHGPWKDTINRLRKEVKNRLPEPQILVGLLQKRSKIQQSSSSLSNNNDSIDNVENTNMHDLITCSTLRILCQYLYVLPQDIELIRFDFMKLLDQPTTESFPIDALSKFYLLKVIGSLRPSLSTNWTSITSLVQLYLSSRNILLKNEAASAVEKRTMHSTLLSEGEDEEKISDWLNALLQGSDAQLCDYLLETLITSLKDLASINPTSFTNFISQNKDMSPLSFVFIDQVKHRLESSNKDQISYLYRYVRSIAISLLGRVKDINVATRFLKQVKSTLSDHNRECPEIDGLLKYIKNGNSSSKHPNPFDFDQDEIDHANMKLIVTFLKARNDEEQLRNETETILHLIDSQTSTRSLIGFFRLFTRSICGWSPLKPKPISSSMNELHFELFEKMLIVLPPNLQRQALRAFIQVATEEFNENGHEFILDSRFLNLSTSVLRFDEKEDVVLAQTIYNQILANLESIINCVELLKFLDTKQLYGLFNKILEQDQPTSSAARVTGHILSELRQRQEDISQTIFDNISHLLLAQREQELLGDILVDCLCEAISKSLKNAKTYKQAFKEIKDYLLSLKHGFTSSEIQLFALFMLTFYEFYKSVVDNKKLFAKLIGQKQLCILQSYIYVNSSIDQKLDPKVKEIVLDKSSNIFVTKILEANKSSNSSLAPVPVSYSINIGQTFVDLSHLEPTFISAFIESFKASFTGSTQTTYSASSLRDLWTFAKVEPKALSILEEYCDASLLWLVRRFAEDDTNTENVIEYINMFNKVLGDDTCNLAFKAFHVEPVLEAIIQNRIFDNITMELANSLSRSLQWNSFKSIKYIRMIAEHRSFQLATATDCESRVPVLKLIEAFVSSSVSSFDSTSCLMGLVNVYHGTNDEADNILFRLFRYAEASKQSVFREVALRWAGMRKNITSASASVEKTEQFNLDPKKVYDSSIEIFKPLHDRQKSSEFYNGYFLLSILSMKFQISIPRQFQWMEILRSGLLGCAICGLISQDLTTRVMADRIMAKAKLSLQETEFIEKDEILFVINHVQNIQQAGHEMSPLIAVFLCQCVQSIASPENSMYPTFMRFLLQRPLIDVGDVPLFYSLLFSSGYTSQKDRVWLISYLTAGMQRDSDWKILRRRQAWELLSHIWGISSLDFNFRNGILKFLHQASKSEKAITDLVSRAGILNWLSHNAKKYPNKVETFMDILNNITNLWNSRIKIPESLGNIDLLNAYDNLVLYSQKSSKMLAQRANILRRISILQCERKLTVRKATDEAVLGQLRNSLLELARDMNEEIYKMSEIDSTGIVTIQALHDSTVRCLGLLRELKVDQSTPCYDSRKDDELFNLSVSMYLCQPLNNNLKKQMIRLQAKQNNK